MEEKERVINNRLQRLIEGIKKANYKDCDREYMARLAEERINELQQREVNCVDKFVQKLLDRISDKEAYLDILMEGRFAIILARNNFLDIEIEYAEKGPDLKARWNRKTAYFEVTRRHSEVDEWGEWAQREGASFVLPDKVENTIGRIRGKLSQLQDNEINIIVIWSDTIRLLPPVIKEAFEYIKQEITNEPKKYKNLSGVLFTEGGGVEGTTLKQFWLFENDKTSKPLGLRLAKKLDSLHERDLKQLQREMDELAAALRRLRSKENQ
jgi:hypothetical protein